MRFVTDEVGDKVRSTEYDPFGNWRAAVGQSNIHMLYQGQQLDNESSLYYLRARYYDPLIGRFISKDPVKGSLTNPQTQNPYAYSLNNPINLSDPSGEFFETAWDIANIAYDICTGDWGALAVDTASAFIPFVPAGITKVGKVAKGLGNISGGSTTANQALKAAEGWLGGGYKEIAPGVYRSADNTRQFRMTDKDIVQQEVHFEAIGPDGREIIENAHIKILNP